MNLEVCSFVTFYIHSCFKNHLHGLQAQNSSVRAGMAKSENRFCVCFFSRKNQEI